MIFVKMVISMRDFSYLHTTVINSINNHRKFSKIIQQYNPSNKICIKLDHNTFSTLIGDYRYRLLHTLIAILDIQTANKLGKVSQLELVLSYIKVITGLGD